MHSISKHTTLIKMRGVVLLVAMIFISTWTASSGQVLSFVPIGGLVTETVGTVQACVTYATLPATETIINLSTRDSSASDGEDYIGIVRDLTFSQTSATEQCVTISILEDVNLEGVEFFDVVIASGGAEIQTLPVIINNVGTVTVGFSQTEYSFNETEGGVVCVVLLGGTIQRVDSVTLTLNATDGSATAADSDYDSVLLVDINLSSSTTSAGECISAAVLPDTILEGDETFTLTINSNAEVNLSPTLSQAQVVIVNDDAECPDPPELLDGSFALSDGGESITGTSPRDATATYSCSLGFDLVGADTLACQLGNVWSPTAPGSCQARECLPLDNPTNGIVTMPSNRVFNTATYSCNDGYTLMGQAMRDCGLDESWTGAAPTCEPRDCGTLTPPNDGSVDYTTTTFMSTATYSCNSGFTVEGDSTRTCQANGTWSGSDPTCRQLAQCGSLANIEDGQVMTPSTQEGGVATYTCSAGYRIEQVENTRTCQADGMWSGSEPTCRELAQCSQLDDIDNGQVTISGTEEGGVATYTCSAGFQVLVGATRTCQADSTWSGFEPTCTMITVVGGLTERQRRDIGIGVGVSLIALIIIILVVVVIVVTVCCVLKKRSSDKYVLNYSTVYGNQDKNELKNRPVEPSKEEDAPEYNERSVDENEYTEEPEQPPQDMDLEEGEQDSAA